MEWTTAVKAALGAHAGPAPGSIGAVISAFGGTKQAAAALGVTTRTVQRYRAAETGQAGQQRGKTKMAAILGKASDAQVKGAAKKLNQSGAQAIFVGEIITSEDERTRTLQATLDPGALADVIRALESGEPGDKRDDAVADALHDAFLDAYHVNPENIKFGDVDSFTLS